MKAEISSCVWLPLDLLDGRELARLKKELTASYLPMGGGKEDVVLVEGYRTDRRGYIGLPRSFGIVYADTHGIELEDRTSRGRKAILPGKIALRDYQEPFTEELMALARDEYDIVAQAATGKGKTTLALKVVQNLQSNAIIVVDQDNLKEQWIERAVQQFGVPRDRIGVVQGKECEYVGKDLVIAMVQTLVQKKFPQPFYEYFGIAIFDECHVFCAPTFSRALMMFSSTLRLGVSATVKRGDSLQGLIHWNLGAIGANLEHKHGKSRVYYVENESVYSWYANTSPKTGRYLQEISEDSQRNALLAEIVQYLYGTGRDTLVISERIEQLEGIMAYCALAGVPTQDMGLYTGYRSVWCFEKDPTPKRRPPEWEKGTAYTPVRYALVRKRIPKKELERVKEESRILFATYGMFAKGVDVPRLSAGVDCTPRSKAQQVHGRILRDMEGKKTPIWVTIRDVNSHRAEYQFGLRLQDYVKDNAEIYKWETDRGVLRADVAELKRNVSQNVSFLKACRYTTTIDGHGTILTPNSRIR